MPFQQIPPDVVLAGFDLASETYPYLGETVNGDALFVETGRHDGAYLLLLVDVTGHGPRTVVTMDTIRNSLLLHRRYQNRGPAELLQLLHEELALQFDETENFAAAMSVLVNSQTRDVVAANAGQPDPRVRQGGIWQTWGLPAGPFLGIDPNATYQEAVSPLAVGDAMLAFTDGVTEGGAKSGVPQFQYGGLQALLHGLPATAMAAEVVSASVRALRLHVGAGWPDDDTTAFCLRRV
jgi:serine phosphatase RsbU (regulator of sigma subunit)